MSDQEQNVRSRTKRQNQEENVRINNKMLESRPKRQNQDQNVKIKTKKCKIKSKILR